MQPPPRTSFFPYTTLFRSLDVGALGLGGLLELIVAPEQLDGLGGRSEGRTDTTEGAVVLARLPDVQLRLDECQRHRQAVSADGLRQRDDVRVDPGLLEAEEATGAAAAHLDVVDDQQDVVLLAQLGRSEE